MRSLHHLHQCFRGGLIGGEGNIVDIAHAEQALDVGLVGVSAEGIDEEEDGLDLPDGDAGGDLGIPAHGAGEHAFDVQARRFGDALARGAGGDELEGGEFFAVALAEGDDFVFLFVMGDEGKGGHEAVNVALQ
jgi:hypothetical protein